MANFDQVEPIAVQNSGIDKQRSLFEIIREKVVAAGQSITREGSLLVRVNQGGHEAVRMSTGTGADVPIGVALTDTTALPQRANMENVIVPAGGVAPFNAALHFGGIIASSYILTNAGTPLVEGGGSDYTIDLTSGVITFTAAYQAANPGDTILVSYQFAMTVALLDQLGGQRNINNQGGAQFGSVSVGMGKLDFYTMCYATARQYAVNDALLSGANGEWTNAAGGTAAGRVTKTPSVGDPWLGISVIL
jgi:hypothetical protein